MGRVAFNNKSKGKDRGPGKPSKKPSSNNVPPPGVKKHGFRIGPKPAPAVYTGKADRIKQNLIDKAKRKKEYAKLLKREGYGNGVRGDPFFEEVSQIKDSQRSDTENDGVAVPSTAEREGEAEFDALHIERRRRLKGKEKAIPSFSSPKKSTHVPHDRSEQINEDVSGEADYSHHNTSCDFPRKVDDGVHPSRRGRFKPDPGPRPKKKKPLSPTERAELERQKEARKQEAQQRREKERGMWNERTRKTGQPKLGKRVEVLLAQIERNVKK